MVRAVPRTTTICLSVRPRVTRHSETARNVVKSPGHISQQRFICSTLASQELFSQTELLIRDSFREEPMKGINDIAYSLTSQHAKMSLQLEQCKEETIDPNHNGNKFL